MVFKTEYTYSYGDWILSMRHIQIQKVALRYSRNCVHVYDFNHSLGPDGGKTFLLFLVQYTCFISTDW